MWKKSLPLSSLKWGGKKSTNFDSCKYIAEFGFREASHQAAPDPLSKRARVGFIASCLGCLLREECWWSLSSCSCIHVKESLGLKIWPFYLLVEERQGKYCGRKKWLFWWRNFTKNLDKHADTAAYISLK